MALVTQNPTFKTLYSDPKDLGCGGMRWLVAFELPKKAGADGWIVQQINRSYDIRKPDGSVADTLLQAAKPPFWEAWQVEKGKVITIDRFDATDEGVTYDDSWDQPQRPGTKGTFKVIGVMKFYEMAALPKMFVKKNPRTRAEDRLSTADKPDFWDGSGTERQLTVTWDCRACGGSKPCPPTLIVTSGKAS